LSFLWNWSASELAFYLKMTRWICAKFFSEFKRKHFVYNLHWKILHLALKLIFLHHILYMTVLN